MTVDWLPDLAARIEALGRWAEGRLVIEVTPSMEVMSADKLLESETLRDAITRAAKTTFHNPPDVVGERAEDLNLRIAASRFTRQYCILAGQRPFVERTGLEPATPCLQSRCSTN